VGVFFTGLKLNTGHSGVAFTPISEIGEAVCCPRSAARMPDAGKLTHKTVAEILDYTSSPNALKSAIGVALVNALSGLVFERDAGPHYEIVHDRDALDLLDIGPTDAVCLIGAFTPYIRRFKATSNPLTIIERSPETLKMDERRYYKSQDQTREVLKHTNAIIITGAAIVNHTLDGLLREIEQGSRVALIGPTVSMIPDIYFRKGVRVMAGVHITNPDSMLRIVEEGGSGYHLYNTCARKVTFVNKVSLSSF
jgi:uncharacterized protein (DUF4213/DUF364 family)